MLFPRSQSRPEPAHYRAERSAAGWPCSPACSPRLSAGTCLAVIRCSVCRSRQLKTLQRKSNSLPRKRLRPSWLPWRIRFCTLTRTGPAPIGSRNRRAWISTETESGVFCSSSSSFTWQSSPDAAAVSFWLLTGRTLTLRRLL